MNFLFWTIALTVAIGAVIQWWLRTRSAQTPDTTEVLSFIGDDRWPLEDGTWSIGEVDFLATAERVRAAVTLEIEGGDATRRREAMEFLAHEIYRRVEVEAVFVEAFGDQGGVESYLFAADGRGWWGAESISTAFASNP